MAADRAAGLRAAAARKRERATARARAAAVRELDQRGEEITFQSVARHAGVSRQWLYEQPALRAEIERLRDQRDRPGTRVPSAQQASDARCASTSTRCARRTAGCARRTPRSRPSSRSPTAADARPDKRCRPGNAGS